MAKRGRMKWVPAIVIDEIEDICTEDNLNSSAEAFRNLIKYARVGRETKRIMTLDFRRRPLTINTKRKKTNNLVGSFFD